MRGCEILGVLSWRLGHSDFCLLYRPVSQNTIQLHPTPSDSLPLKPTAKPGPTRAGFKNTELWGEEATGSGGAGRTKLGVYVQSGGQNDLLNFLFKIILPSRTVEVGTFACF